jgi:hypothetical protein
LPPKYNYILGILEGLLVTKWCYVQDSYSFFAQIMLKESMLIPLQKERRH